MVLGQDDRAKRQKVAANCLAVGSCPKAALAKVLQTLHASGELTSGLGSGTYHAVRRQLRVAQEQHAYTNTPYGRVVQSFALPFPGLKKWDYCHPWAFLYYLSSISEPFAALMAALEAKGPLKILLYIDEVVPGNVMRHDKGRTLQAIYWAVSDWPEWMLCRHESWVLFSVVQSEVCSTIEGGVLSLMPYVLKTFWPKRDVSISTIVHNGNTIALSFVFAGWIADLDAHAKAISSSKTVGATKPCITCENITKWIDTAKRKNGILKGLSCCEPREFVKNTDKSVFQKADELKAAYDSGADVTQMGALSTELGINYSPCSLLFDHTVRHVYKPVTHTIRDWMHMMVSDGVASTEMCLCIKHCLRYIDIERLHSYAVQFRMPRARGGVVPKEWFTTKSLGDHSMKHFASEVLCMVPILNSFLQDVMKERKVMQSHIECFVLLDELICLLSLGADKAVPHIGRIQQLIYVHGKMYTAIYGAAQCRPKFHHLYHVPENMLAINKLVSCFVLERKHRVTKDAARECMRHIEHTVVVDMVNRHCCHAQNNESTYQMQYLLESQPTSVPKTTSASAAVISIGTVHKSDVVFLVDGSVAKVDRLWQDASGLVLQVSPYGMVSAVLWKMDVKIGSRFVDALDVVALLTYAVESANVIRIIVPVLYR